MPKKLYISLLVLLVFASFLLIQEYIENYQLAPAKATILEMNQNGNGQAIGKTDQILGPPNILIILADDLGWRDLGYNFSEIRTPNIDRLAADGVTLNRFYAQPTCSPTRAALLTGKSPKRLGILSPLSKQNPTGLPLSETTLADHLKSANYQTALIGKWHLGPRNLGYHPISRGFDYFYGHLTGGIGYYNKVSGGGYDWQRNGKTLRESGYSTRLLADDAVRYIQQRDPNKPMFLYTAFSAPHLPNEAPQESVESYRSISDPKRRVHAAMVTELDHAVGKIYKVLQEQGIAENTLVWFMSDNGGLVPSNPLRFLPDLIFPAAVKHRFGDHAAPKFIEFIKTNLRDGASDNRPFKGAKQTVLEGGIRVPSFIHWPRTLNSAEYNHMVTVQDVLPTLLDLVDDEPKRVKVDGQSIWPFLVINRATPQNDFIIQVTQPNYVEAIIRYPHKLILGPDNKVRLFDLEQDPFEDTSIHHDNPDLVAEMRGALANFPKGKLVNLPVETLIDDPDFFGGKEDRSPWADQAVGEIKHDQRVSNM